MSDLEAASVRWLPSSIPTWKSYGLHKSCKCSIKNANCDCPKKHLTSIIDNAYLSISEAANFQVLDEAITDHFPILVSLSVNKKSKGKLKTIYRRDISRVTVSDLENFLETNN